MAAAMSDSSTASIIAELEASAHILLAPPNVVTTDQRRAAEAVFLNFQKTKCPFELCRFILETSQVDYVHFQVATLLKQAVIREWTQLNSSDRDSLRAYLFHYVIQRPRLASFVREQLLLVVAIMVKRGGVDGDNEVIQQVLNQVSQLISSGDPGLQTIGCSVLHALLNEYSSTTKASDVGLTWETHLVAKKKFETSDLKRIFQYCLQGLGELADKAASPQEASILKQFLLLAEHVLTWNFQFAMLLPRKLIGLFESQQCPTLRPSSEWKDVLVQANIIQLFFKLHWQLRDHPDLCHHTLQCLNQLASLNGILMNNKDDRILYLSWFLDGLLKLLDSGQVRDHEALSLSNMISRLGVFFPPVILSSLPGHLLQGFLLQLSQLSCLFAQNAANEEAMQKEDQVYSEAFEHLLDTWVTLMQDSQALPQDTLRQSALQIFSRYLQCHLAPPEGLRGMMNSQETDREDIDDVEEDDRTKFKYQLAVIGLLGRKALDHCVPLLAKLLEERVSCFQAHLERLQASALTLADSAQLDSLNEDLHWLIMTTGHLLSPINDGDTSLIPSEVTSYCVQQGASISMETTLRVLANPGLPLPDIADAESVTDPVVRLVSCVFRSCEVERRALEANLSHLLSPEVALTLVWFIQRWALTYLLPNETYYTQLSMTLTGAFGRDSEAGLWTLNFLLKKLEANLSLWGSEPKLATESAQALVSVLNNIERGNRAILCESLVTLVRKQASNQYQLLPAAARRSLLKALVIVGTANKDTATKDKYWEDLLKPLQERFKVVIYSENFPLSYQTESVKNEVLDLIECFVGIVDGCTLQNLPQLFPIVLPIMEELVRLVDVYHNYASVVGTIFQFFCTAAKRLLCFLNQNESKKMYECCLNMMRIYAKHNVGRVSHEASAEEEQFQDLLVLMQLLTDLLSKDFIDFAPKSVMVKIGPTDNNQSKENSAGSSTTTSLIPEEEILAADVALYGLNIIMPMMSQELLKFPSLCLQYYKLITFVGEIYPHKICQLPPELLKTLLLSTQMGLTSFTPEVAALSLDFLSVLGTYVLKSDLKSMHPALQPMLKIVMDMLLMEPLDTDMTLTATGTLFTLICLFQVPFKDLVQELISSQTDATNAARLVEAFNSLTTDVHFELNRYNRAKFKDNFEKFIKNVRGFLCIK